MDIGALRAKIEVDISSLAASQAAVANWTKTTTAAFNQVSQKIRTFGYLATGVLTAPMVMAGKSAMKMASDYEFSMQKIVGLAGVAQDAVNAFNKEVLAMGPQIGKGPRELAEALYFINSSGIKGAQAMEVLTLSAKAAASGLGETKDVANLLTSVLSAYKGSNMTAAKATDILVAAVREGKGEADAFASAIGQIIPIAANLGVSFDQVAGAMAAITLTGSTAATSAVYLKGIFNALNGASKQGETALQSVGSSYTQLREILRVKGTIPLLKEIRDITKAAGDMGEEFLSDIFPNVRGLTGFLSLAGANFKYNTDLMNRVTNSAGSLGIALGAVSDTIKLRYDRAIAQVNVSQITLGKILAETLLPILEKASSILHTITNSWDEASVSQKRHITTIVTLIAALGPLALMYSLLRYTLVGILSIGASVVNMFIGMGKGALRLTQLLFGTTTAYKEQVAATVALNTANTKVAATEVLLTAAKIETNKATVSAALAADTDTAAQVTLANAQLKEIAAEEANTLAKVEQVTATETATLATARYTAVSTRAAKLASIWAAVTKTHAAITLFFTNALVGAASRSVVITNLQAVAEDRLAKASTIRSLQLAQENIMIDVNSKLEASNNRVRAIHYMYEQKQMGLLAANNKLRQEQVLQNNLLLRGEQAYVRNQKLSILATNAEAAATNASSAAHKAQTIFMGIHTAIASKFTAITNGAAVASRFLSTALMTIVTVAVVAALVILGVALANLIKKKEELNEVAKAEHNILEETAKRLGEETTELKILYLTLLKNNVPIAARAQLIAEFNEKYGQYLPNLLTEKSTMEEVAKAYQIANEKLQDRINLEGKMELAKQIGGRAAQAEQAILDLEAEKALLETEENLWKAEQKRKGESTGYGARYAKENTRIARLERIPGEIKKQQDLLDTANASLNRLTAKIVGVRSASDAEAARKLEKERVQLEEQDRIIQAEKELKGDELKAYEARNKELERLGEQEINLLNQINVKKKILSLVPSSGILLTDQQKSLYEDLALLQKQYESLKSHQVILDSEKIMQINKTAAEQRLALEERTLKGLSDIDKIEYQKLIKQNEEYQKEIQRTQSWKTGININAHQPIVGIPGVMVSNAQRIAAEKEVADQIAEYDAKITANKLRMEQITSLVVEGVTKRQIGRYIELNTLIDVATDKLKHMSAVEAQGKPGQTLRDNIASWEKESGDIMGKKGKKSNDPAQLIEAENIRMEDAIKQRYDAELELALGNTNAMVAVKNKEDADLFQLEMDTQQKLINLEEDTGKKEIMIAKRTAAKHTQAIKEREKTRTQLRDKTIDAAEQEALFNEMVIRQSVFDDDELKKKLLQNEFALAQAKIDARKTAGEDVTIAKQQLWIQTQMQAPWFLAAQNKFNKARADGLETYEGQLKELERIQSGSNPLGEKALAATRMKIEDEHFAYSVKSQEKLTGFLQNASLRRLSEYKGYLQDRYDMASTEEERANTLDEMYAVESEERHKRAMERMKNMGEVIDQQVTVSLQNAAMALGTGLGNAMSGMEDPFNAMRSIIADFLIDIGKALISTAILSEAFRDLIKLGPEGVIPAIVVGIAAIAMGTYLKNKLAEGPGGTGSVAMADGGLLYGPTNVLAGEYPGARQNPEVFAPLNKLQAMIQPANSGYSERLVTEISGRKLQVILVREDQYQNRGKR